MTEQIQPKWTMEESSLILTEGYEEDDGGIASRIHSISDPFQSPVTSTEEEDEIPRCPPWSPSQVRVYSAEEDMGAEEEEESELRTNSRTEVEGENLAMGAMVSGPFHLFPSGNEKSSENPTNTIPVVLPGEKSMEKNLVNVGALLTSANQVQSKETEEKKLSCLPIASENPQSDKRSSSMGRESEDSSNGITPMKQSFLNEEEGTALEKVRQPTASTSLVSSPNEPVSWSYALACMHYCISMLCLENYGSPPHKDSLFHSSNIPECSILDYVKRIADHPCFSPTAIIAGILLIFRFMAARFPVDIYCAHRVLLTGASVGSLMNDDRPYCVGYVSSLGGIVPHDLVAIQRLFCEVLKWNLCCYREDYDEFLEVMQQLLENPSKEEVEQFCVTHSDDIASFDDERLKVAKGMKWFLKEYEKDSHRSGYHRSRASGGSSQTSFSRESAGKPKWSRNSTHSVNHSEHPSENLMETTGLSSSSQRMYAAPNSSSPSSSSRTTASEEASQQHNTRPPLLPHPARGSTTSLTNDEEENAPSILSDDSFIAISAALQQTRVKAVLAIHRWNTIFQPWLEKWKKRCALREEKVEQGMQEDRENYRRECMEENKFSTPPKIVRPSYIEKRISTSSSVPGCPPIPSGAVATVSSSFGASTLYRPPAPPAGPTQRGLPQLSSEYVPYRYGSNVHSTAYSTAPSSSAMASMANASLALTALPPPGPTHASPYATSPKERQSGGLYRVGKMEESSGTVGVSGERKPAVPFDPTHVPAPRPYYPSHYYPSASPPVSTLTSGTASVREVGPFPGSRPSHSDPTFHVTHASTNAYANRDCNYAPPSHLRTHSSTTSTSSACRHTSESASFPSMQQSSNDNDADFSSAPEKKSFSYASSSYAGYNTELFSSYASTAIASSHMTDTLAHPASSSLALFSSTIKNGAVGEVHRKRMCSNSFQRFPEGSAKRVEVEDRWKEVQQMAKQPIGRKRCKPKYFKDLFD